MPADDLVIWARASARMVLTNFVQNILLHLLIEAEWRIYASLNWAIIGSDNGLPPVWRQAIIWTNAGILLIGPLGTNFSEILIRILIFSFKKMRLKVSSAKRRPFCLSLNVLSRRITHHGFKANSLWPSAAICHQWSCPSFLQVRAYSPTAPSHYLN